MKPGDIILKEEPYCHILLQKQKGERCDRCLTSQENLKRCTGCGAMYYCDRTCQKRDWIIHRKECQCLRKVSPKTPVDSVRLMLRLLISLDLQLPMNSPYSRKFKDFMSHREDIKADETRSVQFTKIAFTINEYASDVVSLPSATELFDVFCKMVINSFTISDEVLDHIGTGIYLSGSIFDHSCAPNAVAMFHGNTLIVRAITDIEDPSPDKVYISYIEQLATTEDRQQQLESQYYFKCQCSKCCDVQLNQQMKGISCPQCKEQIDFTSDNSDDCSCERCGQTMRKYVHSVRDKLEKCKGLLELYPPHTTEDTTLMLQRYEGMLRDLDDHVPVYNIYYVQLLDRALLAAIDTENWDKAVEYGEKTLSPYRKYFPELSLNYAIQLFKVGKLQLYREKLHDARKNLCKAEIILSSIYKEDVKRSSTYTELKSLIHQCEEELRLKLEHS